MGIYDREYYREGGGAFRWFAGPAPATRTLIAINVAVYLIQILMPALHLEELLGATSRGILREFKVYELITAPFLHRPDEIFPILWNMLFLWWFGSELEGMLGSREFTLLYLASAVLSTLGWALADLAFRGVGFPLMGATGAVTAIAVVVVLFFPTRKILLFFVFPAPLWAFLALFLGHDVYQLLQQLQSGAPAGSVAFAANLTGALCGLIYKQGHIRLERFAMPRFRPRLRVVVPDRREPARPRATSSVARADSARPAREAGPTAVPQDQLDAQLDEVLAKIAREGRESLNDTERRILDEASRRARQRRSSHS